MYEDPGVSRCDAARRKFCDTPFVQDLNAVAEELDEQYSFEFVVVSPIGQASTKSDSRWRVPVVLPSPNGELYRWMNGTTPIEGEWVTLNRQFYEDPVLLHDTGR